MNARNVNHRQYRKLGKCHWHKLIERFEDKAAILTCVSGMNYGGVSVTEDALAKFKTLPHEKKYVLLVSTSGGWSAITPFANLPYLYPSEGRTDEDGMKRPDYRVYDREDLPDADDPDPALLEFVEQMESRRGGQSTTVGTRT